MNDLHQIALALCLTLLAVPARADQLDDLLADMRRGNVTTTAAQRTEIVGIALTECGNHYRSAIAQLYLAEIKASLIDPENHGGWPYRTFLLANKTYLQENLTSELKRMYAAKPDPLLAYALVCPALFAGDDTLVGQVEAYLKDKDPFLYQREQTEVDKFWRPYIQAELKK
jgi:hypothetical protein